MKINTKILSIPPYLTTTWDQISSLYQSNGKFCVVLKQGQTIEIPDLSSENIETILNMYNEQLEKQPKETTNPRFPFNPDSFSNAIQFGISGMDGLGAALQHSQEQSQGPDLPEEMLAKIESIAKIIAPSDEAMIPRPEPHCNCPHCQIARAIARGTGSLESHMQEDQLEEPEISLDDLQFQEWHIEPSGKNDKIYTVSNKLNPEESYEVFLGEPVGCTCGIKGCEHIIAVLNS